MKAVKESDIQAAILHYLTLAGVPAWRTNSGAMRVGKRYIRFAPAGTADICGALPPRGRFLGIEVKRPGGKLRDSQASWLDGMRAAGALVFVARSVEDVQAALRAEGYDVP